MPRTLARAPLLVASLVGASLAGRAQCPEWETFGVLPGTDGRVHALAVFDDGSGPALYAGGTFRQIAGVPASGLARWDGSAWSEVGGGIVGGVFHAVRALQVHDDGSGPALYVGGAWDTIGSLPDRGIARWDGAGWTSLGGGMQGEVYALGVHDDGGGPALFAGGGLKKAGGVDVNNVARWDGAGWSPLAGGVELGYVHALRSFDEGSGPALFVGGTFQVVNGQPLRGLARWDGSSWSQVGVGIGGSLQWVHALEVFDDGHGPGLFVGGDFGWAGAPVSNLARWDGVAWSNVGGGVGPATHDGVNVLEVLDDGSGPALWIGGEFTQAGGLPVGLITRWDGTGFVELGGGIGGYQVDALATYDDGSGGAIWVGGDFDTAGDAGARDLARWDGQAWRPIAIGFDAPVGAFVLHDDGTGPALFAGGAFAVAEGVPAARVVKLVDGVWRPLPNAPFSPGFAVWCLASWDDGSGPALWIAGGEGAGGRLYRWDGALVSVASFEDLVSALAVFDDGAGAALYAGGYFASVEGVAANAIARFDGAHWSPLGGGAYWFPHGNTGEVNALCVWEDQHGSALFVGGRFDEVGHGTTAWSVARWDGTSWTGLIDPSGGKPGIAAGAQPGHVHALAVHDDGDGPRLHVAGSFQSAGAAGASSIAAWDGRAWRSLGAGVAGGAYALCSYDDGTGVGGLLAGGTFTSAGGAPVERLAAWDGASWSPVSSVQGLPGLWSQPIVGELQPYYNGLALRVAVGGRFFEVGGQASAYVGLWGGCPDASVALAYCAGDGVVVACPCGNNASPGSIEGCANSSGAGGRLVATGTASLAAGDLVLVASQLPATTPGIVAAGLDKSLVPFGAGLLCIAPPVDRFPVEFADADGSFQVPDPAAFLRLQAGQSRTFQAWYRDLAGPCGSRFNLTNALSIVFTP